MCVHASLCLRVRHIDILYCDPLTPDNSNQQDEWEAKGGGGKSVENCYDEGVCLHEWTYMFQ